MKGFDAIKQRISQSVSQDAQEPRFCPSAIHRKSGGAGAGPNHEGALGWPEASGAAIEAAREAVWPGFGFTRKK